MENKKDKKLMKIIISIIIILGLLLILVIARLRSMTVQEDKELEIIKSYTTIDDFKTIEEVAKYLECDYKKQEKSKVENYNLDLYIKIKVPPYTDNDSNEGFYNKLISYSAKVLKFDNFRIIDKENNITIEVVCNKEKENISIIIINGESNYFAKRDSEIQMNNFKQVEETNLTIQSDILTKLISNNWRLKESDIGTKESTFNSYDIYFDEGVEVRKIDNKVFNIVFTEKYKLNIVNNITTSSSKEDIIKILGEPTFSKESAKLIGYKGKDMYIFFNYSNFQVSVYRVEKDYNPEKFVEIVQKLSNNEYYKNDLIENLKESYNGYDSYTIDKNREELVYSLLGIKIQFGNNIKNGIIIFNNYSGQVAKDIDIKKVLSGEMSLPNNVYLNNKDLVYECEENRILKIDNIKYAASMELQNLKDNQKNDKFYTTRTYIDESTYSVKFLSKDLEYPSSELNVNINSDLWINEYTFLYSIKNKGIYLYNLQNGKYYTLVTGEDEEFELIEFKNYELKYDDKVFKLK